MSKNIFLDNAATTKMYPEVLESMMPWLNATCRNASAAYTCAAEATQALEHAQNVISKTIHARPDEIFFTSGGSESDNWAVKGIADANRHKGNHIITSCIEHPAVLNTCIFLERHGYDVTYLSVDTNGFVHIPDLIEAIKDDTILISIMMANNEIGTIEPIADIGKIAREHHIPFHTDAVQAYGHIPIDVYTQNIDILSASGHKFGGPQGIGFIYIRKGIDISNLVHGGNQQLGMRGGTENIAAITGLAKAAELSCENMSKTHERLCELQKYLMHRIITEIKDTTINGSMTRRLTNNINCTIKNVPGSDLVRLLGMRGICISTASACMAGEQKTSHVLNAIQLSNEAAESTIRISLGYDTTITEINIFIMHLIDIVNKIRLINGSI